MASYPPSRGYPDDQPGAEIIERHAGGRTPSPTPSEVQALTTDVLNFKRYMNWKFWARKDWIPWYIIGTVVLIATILIAVFDKQLVHWLTPAGRWMKNLSFGWLIPIAILFIISFPPLFGHEIVAILCGVIWGLGVGFLIVCAGTFLGELGNYYAFKYCCRARGEKMEKTSISYACLARVVREGGFTVALIIRLSVIPGHFSTAVFSTCGMGVIIFSLAALFSLPKQLITVYIGVIIEENGTGAATTKDKIISDSVLAVTILITFGAGYYIWREINRVKPRVIYDRRKARQVKFVDMAYDLENASTPNLYPTDADVIVPLRDSPRSPASFTPRQPNRQGSGNYAGYGGYMPSYSHGPYGVEEGRKSGEVVGWETRGPRVADMRGARWKVASGQRKNGHASDDEDSEEGHTSSSVSRAVHPRPNSTVYPNPYEEPSPQPGHTFELSDPPVEHHTPLPSDSTYQYPPSLHPHAAHAQTDVSSPHTQSYSHGTEPSDATFDSRYPLTLSSLDTGHSLQPTDSTDASYYTAVGGVPQPPQLAPIRTVSPMTLGGQRQT